MITEILDFNKSANDKELSKVVDYVNNFLSKPDSNLGRSGDVCPFTRKAAALDCLKFIKVTKESYSLDFLESLVNNMKDTFSSLKVSNDDYKCLLAVFINMDEKDFVLIDEIQAKMKLKFVVDGLMVGQFHPQCMASGLHNNNFYPLQSPIPMLVVRHMAKTDIAFLQDNSEYLFAYNKKFAII